MHACLVTVHELHYTCSIRASRCSLLKRQLDSALFAMTEFHGRLSAVRDEYPNFIAVAIDSGLARMNISQQAYFDTLNTPIPMHFDDQVAWFLDKCLMSRHPLVLIS